MIEAGCNITREPLVVEHFLLTPASEAPNRFASQCPMCKEGILPVRRDRITLKIKRFDCCLLCGQRVIYLDVEDLRRKDPLNL